MAYFIPCFFIKVDKQFFNPMYAIAKLETCPEVDSGLLVNQLLPAGVQELIED